MLINIIREIFIEKIKNIKEIKMKKINKSINYYFSLIYKNIKY